METSGFAGSSGPGLSRRALLKVGGLGMAGAGLTGLAGAAPRSDRAVIFLFLVGGPSQLDTFDPKPDAPREIRGPFRSIATSIPGVRLGEHLPRLAARMGKVALIRSMHHDAAPIHETGEQLLQTGRLVANDDEAPHFGSVVARARGTSGDAPAFAILPGLIGPVGMWRSHGQSAGPLGDEFAPRVVAPESVLNIRPEPASIAEAYGPTPFGRSCLAARRLVEAGTRVAVVNMYPTVYNAPSWDCHGSRGFATLDDYARDVVPTFDRAFAALIDDLDRLGRLDSTLVVATGEFGRTPRINTEGGRDHWLRAWTALLAGGGVAGGRVIGRTDRHCGEPADRPVRPEALLATIYASLGMDSEAGPIREVFA